ncbi:TPA: hypothetical protein KRH68_000740 [Clostridioides difficile]|nr:hypothetical protein [Clostridioides difficile]EII6832857.1 hypothetical protein [Clostridioides difficile]EJA6689289.1 hypothetical protein [Clostridioides difficile]EJA6942073.1 hypothetical protein [Clostridioides difficile]EQE87094.1 hypothetical protein QCQ_0285 [Clostridioides difficile CD49]MBJ8625396.1 hypothetical protein [Clostridioides difficile]
MSVINKEELKKIKTFIFMKKKYLFLMSYGFILIGGWKLTKSNKEVLV